MKIYIRNRNRSQTSMFSQNVWAKIDLKKIKQGVKYFRPHNILSHGLISMYILGQYRLYSLIGRATNRLKNICFIKKISV